MSYNTNAVKAVIMSDYTFMLNELTSIVKEAAATIAHDPEEYTEHGCDEPSIDVRLCIDSDGSWIFRTGDSSFDQRHSPFCASGSLDGETKPVVLLERLMDQLMDQIVERDSA